MLKKPNFYVKSYNLDTTTTVCYPISCNCPMKQNKPTNKDDINKSTSTH